MRVLVPGLGAGGWRHGAIRPLWQEEIKVGIVQCGHLLCGFSSRQRRELAIGNWQWGTANGPSRGAGALTRMPFRRASFPAPFRGAGALTRTPFRRGELPCALPWCGCPHPHAVQEGRASLRPPAVGVCASAVPTCQFPSSRRQNAKSLHLNKRRRQCVLSAVPLLLTADGGPLSPARRVLGLPERPSLSLRLSRCRPQGNGRGLRRHLLKRRGMMPRRLVPRATRGPVQRLAAIPFQPGPVRPPGALSIATSAPTTPLRSL